MLPIVKQIKIFQITLRFIFFIFLGILGIVIVIAHTRRSGATGIKTDQLQKIRSEAPKDRS